MVTSERPSTTSPADLSCVPDDALMRRAAHHDARAFEAFYDRHISSAWAVSFRAVGTAQRADDVCQEAFLSVWRAAGRFDPARGTARSWVLAIVRNRAIDQLRVYQRTTDRDALDDASVELQPTDPLGGTESSALRNVSSLATRRLLHVLDADQQQVVELAFFRGLSHAEIAVRLGLPLGTVKARIQRGLARMRAAAGGPGPDTAPAQPKAA
ncbi:RNA polymerase sigma factor [Patulibacter sp.]|uniref:RNA polymerase sigma factor n=1 Tax=Patulibacter sp. TaxID=1912859 RepID=UPI00271A6EB7|nr:RNA polymerase sigma factor [Patulibacter sp.]MDO9410852.1 RNA polymerase sigma factor [Patulibacter sp.]